ncbi:hypothetical protein MMC25_005889 [Agyrium rufum]|nr:hypothetical protein [Agyrium rufum]
MAEQAHNVSKAEAKPRRNVQYKDLANAVARLDNLEFLSDVVPRTTTYREYRRQKAEKQASKSAKAAEAGQTTLDGKRIGGLPDRHASLDLSQLTEDPASPLSPDRRPPPHANRHEGPSQIESSLPIHYGNLGQGSGQQLETNGVPREGPDRDTEMREVYY